MVAGRAKKTRPCPACSGRMTLRTKAEQLTYKGAARAIRTKAWWRNSCDEGILTSGALRANEKAYLKLKAEVDGLLKPTEVAAIRKRLRMSQRRAGEVLGGGPRAFQKYEAGTVAVSAAMSNLLRLLDGDPKRLRELEDLTQVRVDKAS